jgi:hypothetical protein
MRLLVIALVALTGCSLQMGITNRGAAFQGTLADVRVGWKVGEAGDVHLEQSKEPISEDFAEALPELVARAVQVGMTCAGLGSAAALVDACPIPKEVHP